MRCSRLKVDARSQEQQTVLRCGKSIIAHVTRDVQIKSHPRSRSRPRQILLITPVPCNSIRSLEFNTLGLQVRANDGIIKSWHLFVHAEYHIPEIQFPQHIFLVACVVLQRAMQVPIGTQHNTVYIQIQTVKQPLRNIKMYCRDICAHTNTHTHTRRPSDINIFCYRS